MSPQPRPVLDVAVDAAVDERSARDAGLARCLAAARAGDARAYEAFYDQTFAAARALARRLLRQLEPSAVEDLLADAYFEAWRHCDRFDAARGGAMTWLLTLVRSRCLDLLRSRVVHPSAGGVDDADGERRGDAPSTDPDPAEALWRRQAGARLQAALAQLAPAERWVLGLAYLREMSQSEIASATGMPLGTVKSHAQRAQARLRLLLTATAAAPTE